MKRFLICLIIFLFGAPCAFAVDMEQKFVNGTGKMIIYVDQHQEDVWPNYHLSTTPLVIYFPASQHSYAFNFIPKNPDWQKLIINDKPVYYLPTNELGLTSDELEFQYTIDGQSCFVISLPIVDFDPNDVIENDVSLAHERFHLYTFRESHFPPLKDVSYDGFNNLMNVKLAYLEIEALLAYLNKNDDKAEEALKDAVSIHQYRLKLLNKESQLYEKELEVMEGITNYVGFKSVGLSYHELAQHIALYMPPQCKLEALSKIDNVQQCLDWASIYFTEPAIGRALDHKLTSPSWKSETEKKGESFQTLIKNYYQLNQDEIDRRTHEAMKNKDYHFDTIDQTLDSTLTPYLNAMNEQQKNYQSEPGIEMQVDFVSTLEQQNQHDDQAYLINTNLELWTNASGDYKADDGTEEIHYKNIPLLYDDTRTARFTPSEYQALWEKFKVVAETEINVDGKITTVGDFIASGKTTNFNQLNLTNSQVNIMLKGVNGILDGGHGTLKIIVPQNNSKRRMSNIDFYSYPKNIGVIRNHNK